MADVTLTWGKCTLTYKNGTESVSISPKIDSTKLNVAEGATQEAKIEGGEVIAVRRDSDSYTLEWQEHIHPANVEKRKASIKTPNMDVTDLSVVSDNTEALRIDVPKASIHSSFSFDTQGGILLSCKATFVKTDGKELFDLKAGTTPHQ